MHRKIHFFSEGNPTPIPFLKKDFRQLAKTIFSDFKQRIAYVNVILCDDEYLLEINRSYLAHDTYTDIITFDDNNDPKGSDMFISTTRIAENALSRGVSPGLELRRVFVHGCLHLCGLGDKTPLQKKNMRAQEDQYLLL